MTIEQTALARLLQDRREAVGVSRAALGEALGISKATIENWELGRIRNPGFHEVLRVASLLRIPFEDLQRAVFADRGTVPEVELQAADPLRKRPGRKKGLGAVPLLEAAFRLYGWKDEADAAEALGTTPDSVRAWRRGNERMDIAEYMTLTMTVNVALVDAVKSRKPKSVRLSAAAEALGVQPDP